MMEIGHNNSCQFSAAALAGSVSTYKLISLPFQTLINTHPCKKAPVVSFHHHQFPDGRGCWPNQFTIQNLWEHISNLNSNTPTSHSFCPELPSKVTGCVLASHWQTVLSCTKAASKSQWAEVAVGSQGTNGNVMLKIVEEGTYIQVN